MATNFKRGLQARGVPLEGGSGARYTGWWGVTSRFVDYDHGADGNSGIEPTSAYLNLQTAINASVIGDVIYIRNRDQDITATDPEAILPASTTNWSVAETQTHLSIIGASNVSHIPTAETMTSVILKGHATANTTAVMDWRGAFGLLENLGFHRGASTAGGLVALTGNSTSLRALGTTIANCLFRLSNHAVGSLYNLDNWWVTVYGCVFHDCRVGIEFHGSASTVRRNSIIGCTFRNQTATSVDTNILLNGSSTQDVYIADCDFTTTAPNYSGGSNVYIRATNTATGLIVRCSFPTDTAEGTSGITNNGIDMLDCHQLDATANSEAFGKT